MTAAAFRRIALGMKNAVEGAHMGHPDFRINGRIFATLRGSPPLGMVVLTPEEQQVLVEEHPDVFQPESGAWGRAGCTRVHLAAADAEQVGEAMTLAYRRLASKGPAAAKRASARPARRRTSAARRRS
jgi:hypothetical protein